MRDYNAVREKSLAFAVRIVKLSRYIQEKFAEYILSKQLCRSGTSVGANIREALMAVSAADFLAKMHVALKEIYETEYWIELLYRTNYISDNEFQSIFNDCNELTKLLTSITKTTKERITDNKDKNC